jgi:hypothetical protein
MVCMKAPRVVLLSLAVALAPVVAGCAGGSVNQNSLNCSNIPQAVFPVAASADHTLAPPGDQQSFGVQYTDIPAGCAVPAFVIAHTWQTSAPLQVSISSATDSTNGQATCLAATNGPVTISTVPASSIAPATLTCK